MFTSISTAVSPSPPRTSAKTERARSSVLGVRPGDEGFDPRIRASPALNASAGVKTRKRGGGRGDLHRFLRGERAGQLRKVELPPAAGALVAPAVGAA